MRYKNKREEIMVNVQHRACPHLGEQFLVVSRDVWHISGFAKRNVSGIRCLCEISKLRKVSLTL
jgi:hypothetical protein